MVDGLKCRTCGSPAVSVAKARNRDGSTQDWPVCTAHLLPAVLAGWRLDDLVQVNGDTSTEVIVAVEADGSRWVEEQHYLALVLEVARLKAGAISSIDGPWEGHSQDCAKRDSESGTCSCGSDQRYADLRTLIAEREGLEREVERLRRSDHKTPSERLRDADNWEDLPW